MVLRGGRWLVFLVLSGAVNLLIASAVTLTTQPPPPVPALTVNLMARAAPAAVPQAVPEPTTEPVKKPVKEPIVEPVPEPVTTAQPIPQPKQPPLPEKPLTPPVSPPLQKVATTPQAVQKVIQKEPAPQKITPKKAPPQVVKPRPKIAHTPPKEQVTKDDHKKDPPKKERVAPKKEIAAKTQPPKTPPKKAPPEKTLKQTVGVSRDQGQETATVLHEARYRQQTPPLYPRRALDLGQQGTAILHVEVTHDGFTRTLKVAQSSGHRLLDRAALAAVRKWEFEPTEMNGKRITSWVRVPVNFIIQSSQ